MPIAARSRALSSPSLRSSLGLLVLVPGVARAARQCEGLAATISGTNADEVIEGTTGNDVIHGAGGSDVIDGKGGNDIICGGNGSDELIGGSGNDVLIGGNGLDTLRGKNGDDLLKGGPGADFLDGGPGRDELKGQDGADKMHGGADDDVLIGGKGSDDMSGDDGNDVLEGRVGSDTLRGNNGNDTIDAGKGSDKLIGGAGDDWLHGNVGADTANGGDGQDSCLSARRVEWVGYENFLTPSATTRSTFEITISKDYIRAGMPEEDFYWVSESIPGGLDFDKGVVQFGHNSYDVFDCDGCSSGPNTWHWDNIYLAPAEPITALPANKRHVSSNTSSYVTFGEPAPKGSYLQFTGIGNDLEVSFDTGLTWLPVKTQHSREIHSWRYKNYSMKVPVGTSRVDFRGEDLWDGPWHIQDISILSKRIPGGKGMVGQFQNVLNRYDEAHDEGFFCSIPLASDSTATIARLDISGYGARRGRIGLK